MKRLFRTHLLGPLIASIAAAAVFLIAYLTVDLVTGSSLPVTNEPLADVILKSLLVAGAFIVIGTPIGILYAIVPNLIGNAVMHWVGSHMVAARAGGTWAIVGALAAGVPAALIAASNNAAKEGISVTMAFSITGGVCALICRRFTRWVDEGD